MLTVSRGTHDEARAATARPAGAGHVFSVVPFTGPPVHMADAWPRRVAAERGLRRALRRAGPVDVLHLRMADVGSMAAAAVAATPAVMASVRQAGCRSKSRRRVRGPVTERTSSKRLVPQNVTVMDVPV